ISVINAIKKGSTKKITVRPIGYYHPISIDLNSKFISIMKVWGQFKKLEKKSIPENFSYDDISGFSNEVAEKLSKIRPASVGQASRISGITPAAISLLLVSLERHKRIKQTSQTM
ncbi:MAG: hypothetical protein IH978_07180, partial [Nitrospinae bacterium]|nr:hypothetical protein [Nitrospinota bacterium]